MVEVGQRFVMYPKPVEVGFIALLNKPKILATPFPSSPIIIDPMKLLQ